MRVLQLGKYYEPHVGGMETHLGLLAHGLTARGLDVEVLVHGGGRRTLRETVRGIPVTRVGALGRLMSTEFSPSLVTELSRLYDVLHLHTPHPMAMVAYLAARKPAHALVITHHSDIVRQARVRSVLQPLFRAVLERADAIIATSQRYLESSDELKPYRTKVKVIPYGIDLQRFSPSLKQLAPALEIRSKHGTRIVLATGRLIYYKGFEVLLDAMRTVRAHLLLVGDGPLRAALEARARRNGVGDRVTFVGSVPNEDMGRYYGAADVFALPSIARSEAFGIVQIEALASTLPVVNTSLASGVPDVSLHDVTGLTVAPNDAGALADALNRLLDDPEFARRLGNRGRECALERFSADRMVDETVALYREVTPSSSVRALRFGFG
jgi:rhamnosyl/mannosyltransferase